MTKLERIEMKDVLLSIFFPILLQNLIGTLVNLVDSIMVGQLGDISIAAVGLSNQFFLIINLLMFGVSSGIAVFMVQYFGKKDFLGLKKSMLFGLLVIVPFTLLTALLAFVFPKAVLSLFTNDVDVISEGIKYLRVVSLSYVPIGISLLLSYAYRSIGKVKYSVRITTTSLMINIILNYFLIFGVRDFAGFGVMGAALATVIARSIQVIALISFAYLRDYEFTIKSFKGVSVGSEYVSRFIKTSGYVFFAEVMFGIGSAMIFAIFGRISTTLTAGANIGKTIENLLWIFYWSYGASASVYVGRYIGAGNKEKAYRHAVLIIKMAFVTGFFLSLLLVVLIHPILSLYDVSDKARHIARTYLWIIVVTMPFKGCLKALTGGAFRSGGDTKFSMIIEVVPLWLTLLIVSILVSNGLSNTFVILAIVIGYELFKVIPAYLRLRSKKWINNIV